jgi:hypothetical protein
VAQLTAYKDALEHDSILLQALILALCRLQLAASSLFNSIEEICVKVVGTREFGGALLFYLCLQAHSKATTTWRKI